MAEGEGITATEEGSARGEFRGGILHYFIVTLFTPKCNLCNLDYNLGAKPLNSLNLSNVGDLLRVITTLCPAGFVHLPKTNLSIY